MTELLYLNDHYLREFDAKIVEIPDYKSVVLDRTAIYPRGGGQPSDKGWLVTSDGKRKLQVIDSQKDQEGGRTIHVLGTPLSETDKKEILGASVHGIVDWKLRYIHMRHHTALHILSGVVYHKFNSKITGGQIYQERARLDFTLSDLSPEKVSIIESEMNRIVDENRPVRSFWLSRDEALRKPELYRLSANLLPEDLEKLRIVEIVGFDSQLDGGTHVANTGEVGRIKISRTENKWKDNKRIEIVLSWKS